MTSTQSGLPHSAEFTAANPDIIQHRCEGPECEGDERIKVWRNCDRHIRNWWKANRHLVKSRHVVFLEWDVVCNVRLDTIFRPLEGLVCSEIKRRDNPSDDWYWFCEVPKLPAEMQVAAIGVVPLATLQLTREALDALCEARHDALYEQDIFCELRTPSLLQHLGFPIQTVEALSKVTWEIQPYPSLCLGIFHPVKKSHYLGLLTRLMRRCFGQR